MKKKCLKASKFSPIAGFFHFYENKALEIIHSINKSINEILDHFDCCFYHIQHLYLVTYEIPFLFIVIAFQNFSLIRREVHRGLKLNKKLKIKINIWYWFWKYIIFIETDGDRSVLTVYRFRTKNWLTILLMCRFNLNFYYTKLNSTYKIFSDDNP